MFTIRYKSRHCDAPLTGAACHLTCAGHPATSRQQYALLLLFSLNFPFSSSPRPRSLLLLLFQSKHLLSALSKLMPLLLAYSAIVSIFHAGGDLQN